MKRIFLLVALAVGLGGCVTPPPAEPIHSAISMASPAEMPPVRADQITSENARQVAENLATELNWEAQREIAKRSSNPYASAK